MNEVFFSCVEEEAVQEERQKVHQDLTQSLSESVDLQDFHDKMSKYFNEEG